LGVTKFLSVNLHFCAHGARHQSRKLFLIVGL
jgi:hypothetical protein